MQIFVNGAPHPIAAELTVRALVEELGLTAGPVAVEVNRAIVPRAEHIAHLLHDGDKVEIVHLVGGG